MTDMIRRLMTGFVSTVTFFAVFAVAGDVLIAAGVAVTGAIAQFALAMTAHCRPGAIGWTASLASLGVVVALTGTTLSGETATTQPWSPASVSCIASASRRSRSDAPVADSPACYYAWESMDHRERLFEASVCISLMEAGCARPSPLFFRSHPCEFRQIESSASAQGTRTGEITGPPSLPLASK